MGLATFHQRRKAKAEKNLSVKYYYRRNTTDLHFDQHALRQLKYKSNKNRRTFKFRKFHTDLSVLQTTRMQR